ncbi:Protein-lysine N-methyltransferase efm3 (Elongation factor methyltransferase 3) [Durusdinium trenchii]|uniref:Protein-lysine N-methyltransferase efm3 (Elongation factor methyltransferase 3) n=1 Tax=Durusdinium trenchii TaxID=1381693 RepID=A0ABP0L4L1_9DINO
MSFHAADHFMGCKPGFAFKLGPLGLGYYADDLPKATEAWNFGSSQVFVKVDVSCGVGHTGLRIWPAARAMAHLLAESLQPSASTDLPSDRPDGPRVNLYSPTPGGSPCAARGGWDLHRQLDVRSRGRALELGAGCGLVSALLASLGADVTATDGAAVVVRRLRETSELNQKPFKVRELGWDGEDGAVGEERLPCETGDGNHGDTYDVILGADITYDCKPKTLESLLDLISKLSGEETLTLLAHGLRNVEHAMFLWSKLTERWNVQVQPPPPWNVDENEDSVLIFAFEGRISGGDWQGGGRVLFSPSEDVTPEQAMDYVLGYTCANDLSTRDWQKIPELSGSRSLSLMKTTCANISDTGASGVDRRASMGAQLTLEGKEAHLTSEAPWALGARHDWW